MCPPVTLLADFEVWERALDTARHTVSDVTNDVTSASHKVLPLSVRFWQAERNLKRCLAQTAAFVSRPRPEITSDPRVTQKAERVVTQMFQLAESIEQLYAQAKRRGLTNRTLTAASLNLMKAHAEELFNLAENMSLIFDPATQARFDSIVKDFDDSEFVGMEIFE